MKILESKFVQGFIKMADDGYKQGWHERNGGNLSYRLKAEEVEMIRPRLNAPGEWTPIGVEVPGLAGEFFLVTGSGKYFRNIIVDPEVCLAIIELDETGTNYRIRWGLVEGGRPTSELPTHLMNHEVKKKLTNGKHRVIYHAHTFVLPRDDKVFTRELWESATECPVVFPDGVGVIGWMVPGGREIAIKTAELMKKYDVVIWAHHGMFCSGEDFDLTFGLLHTVEKSAEILVKILSMAPQKLQTITPNDFRALAKDFKVTLFLSEALSETTKYLLIFADKSVMIKTYLVYQQINFSRKDMDKGWKNYIKQLKRRLRQAVIRERFPVRKFAMTSAIRSMGKRTEAMCCFPSLMMM